MKHMDLSCLHLQLSLCTRDSVDSLVGPVHMVNIPLSRWLLGGGELQSRSLAGLIVKRESGGGTTHNYCRLF